MSDKIVENDWDPSLNEDFSLGIDSDNDTLNCTSSVDHTGVELQLDANGTDCMKTESFLLCDLSQAGKYSYAVLCGLTLHNLYGENVNDKIFRDDFVGVLSKHLQLKSQVEATVYAFANGIGDDNPMPLVKVLRQETVVKKHGPKVLLHNLLNAAVINGIYDARSRTLAKHLSLLLQVEPDVLIELEDAIVNELVEIQQNHQPSEEEMKEKKKQEGRRHMKKVGLVAAATVGGGVLLGLTGGLAAPMLAVGLGTLLGTGSAVLGSTAGVALIGSLFGVAGAGLGAYKMQRRVADVSEFQFESLTRGRSLHVTIAVPGWLTNEEPDCRHAWLRLADSREQFVLCYEAQELIQVGQAMDYLTSFALSAATQQALQYTVLAGVLAAISWPAALLSASCFIDNPWSVCMERAIHVGRLMAEVLLAREQGQRPVTLIGFSIGARVIFYCLLEMARYKSSAGVVEDAVLLGAPVTTSEKDWETVSTVVSGRVINGYCRSDWQLKFVYRATSMKFSVAGLGAIPVASRRMHNVDLSDVIQTHSDYATQLDTVLSVLGIKVDYSIKNMPKLESSVVTQFPLPSDSTKKNANLSPDNVSASKSDSDILSGQGLAAAYGVTPRRVQSTSTFFPSE